MAKKIIWLNVSLSVNLTKKKKVKLEIHDDDYSRALADLRELVRSKILLMLPQHRDSATELPELELVYMSETDLQGDETQLDDGDDLEGMLADENTVRVIVKCDETDLIQGEETQLDDGCALDDSSHTCSDGNIVVGQCDASGPTPSRRTPPLDNYFIPPPVAVKPDGEVTLRLGGCSDEYIEIDKCDGETETDLIQGEETQLDDGDALDDLPHSHGALVWSASHIVYDSSDDSTVDSFGRGDSSDMCSEDDVQCDGMDTGTIVVTIRDNDPLNVPVRRLTTHSSVFRHLIHELGLTELELEDFAPDIVFLFCWLLEDNKVEEIQELQFRELHKLSVVFKVEWLIKRCREWLVEKINCVESDMGYDDQFFLFEECRYILDTWKVGNFVNLLISRLVLTDNNAMFFSQYLRDFDNLDTEQLNLMLQLAGSANTKIILAVIIERISDKDSLDENTKFLVKNINLAWCFEQNEELYHQLFDKISTMSEISKEDGGHMFRLLAESIREVSSRRNYRRSTAVTTVFDSLTWSSLVDSCNTYHYIMRLVAEERASTSMFDVVNLLTYFTHSDNSHGTEESERFNSELVNISRDKPMNKVSSQYIDMLISGWRLLEREESTQLIKTLEIILDSDNLSSYHENVQLVAKRVVQKKLFRAEGRIKDGSKLLFEFKHPGISHCELRGKCGFTLKYVVQRDANYKVELCTEETDYKGTGVHYHDIVSVEDMNYYSLVPGITRDGLRLRVPVWWWMWWGRLLSHITWEEVQLCVDFNISKYLVAKH